MAPRQLAISFAHFSLSQFFLTLRKGLDADRAKLSALFASGFCCFLHIRFMVLCVHIGFLGNFTSTQSPLPCLNTLLHIGQALTRDQKTLRQVSDPLWVSVSLY